MRSFSLLAFSGLVSAIPAPQSNGLAGLLGQLQNAACPAIPPNDVNLGEAVPIKPGDVPAGCNDYEVLVARGTSEPNYAQGGKFGVIVGDPVISNLTLKFPAARGYPVQYDASASLFSASRGTADVVNRIRLQSARCPNQKFALVGYSQGALVMRNAANDLSPLYYSKIVALAMFGDPGVKGGLSGALIPSFPAALSAKLLENCADGDLVCDPDGECAYYHLTYLRPSYIDATVNFLISKYQGS